MFIVYIFYRFACAVLCTAAAISRICMVVHRFIFLSDWTCEFACMSKCMWVFFLSYSNTYYTDSLLYLLNLVPHFWNVFVQKKNLNENKTSKSFFGAMYLISVTMADCHIHSCKNASISDDNSVRFSFVS